MKYIKNCPECGKQLRFPLDRGRIRIHCRCGYSSIVDPDDTTLYSDGKFDLSDDGGSRKKTSRSILSLKSKLDKKRIINGILEIKYKIQNLRYMPDRERNRFLAAVIVILLLLITAVYYL